jgi:MFS family permease
MFLMMTNGFGCILGGVVSGKVVEMYTTNGITDWQPVWLIFAAYSLVWPSPSSRCSSTSTCACRTVRSALILDCCARWRCAYRAYKPDRRPGKR